jgi:hypothetical protein
MRHLPSILLLIAALAPGAIAEEKKKAGIDQVLIPHEVREIEGWTVHVDTSLLRGEHRETGDLALKILGQRLHRITMVIPAGPLKKMQEVPIYLDRAHPLGGAHFHPSAGWLKGHGYDPAMAKAVHFTNAKGMIRMGRRPAGGSAVLHELSHAYHNRVLGFNHEELVAGYKRFRASGKFEMVPYASGNERPHYGLMNQMEYFAEMTEAFFAVNDFYPFVRSELITADPETYRLIGRIWGVDAKTPGKRRLDRQDLMILATVKSERGLHDEALKLLDQAEKRNPGNERVAGLRKKIEAAKAKSPSK